ncbi:MAG: hypothetical protein AAGF26_05460 [Cyanobacteria bacterium P01_G01_bin.49]
MDNRFLGIVETGKFKLLLPTSKQGLYLRLTTLPVNDSQSPESDELDLSRYEGQALMVLGYDLNGWLWSANVIDQAKPILTSVVQKLCQDVAQNEEQWHLNPATDSHFWHLETA